MRMPTVIHPHAKEKVQSLIERALQATDRVDPVAVQTSAPLGARPPSTVRLQPVSPERRAVRQSDLITYLQEAQQTLQDNDMYNM